MVVTSEQSPLSPFSFTTPPWLCLLFFIAFRHSLLFNFIVFVDFLSHTSPSPLYLLFLLKGFLRLTRSASLFTLAFLYHNTLFTTFISDS